MKKILIIIPFLSVLLFLSSSFSVKANNVTSFPAFPEPVEGKSSTHYLVIYDSVNSNYYLYKPLDPQNVYVTNEDGKLVLNFVGSPAISYIWEAGEGSTVWYRSSELGIDPTSQNVVINGYDDGTVEFLYSSFDLFYDDGELFFQRAPIKESFLAQMKKVEMGAVMETVAKMVPVVMIAVAGFLGFRKAFNLLLRVLQGA